MQKLLLSNENVIELEKASQKHHAVMINEREIFLAPFEMKTDCVHSSCGCCDDVLSIDDVRGRAVLSALYDAESGWWFAHAMRPVFFGLIGFVGADLFSLKINGKEIGEKGA